MKHAAIAVLLFFLAMGESAPSLADGVGEAGSTMRGCCACSQCGEADRCADGETLVSCSAACASAGCQRVSFSLKGTCGGGCATPPEQGAADGAGSEAP
jgi:hypothetical protein